MTATLMLRSGIACLVFIGGIASRAESRNLSDQINSLFGQSGIVLDVDATGGGGAGSGGGSGSGGGGGGGTGSGAGDSHRAHFSSSSLATLGLLVKQLAPNAADFPAISTVPGFTYRYNPDLLSFERSSSSLGPVFIERPQTLGRGKFDVGFSYLFVDFDELEGKDLDRLSFRGLQHNDCCNDRNPPPSPNVPAFEQDTAELSFEKFTLRSHVMSFFATYGITDHWDVNFLLPVVFTSLDVQARAVLHDESGTDTHFFDVDEGKKDEVRAFDDDVVGIGDLLLRTKYRLFDNEAFSLASGLTLRVPTGEEDDFQGLGDTTLQPFLALAFEYGRLHAHASSGIDINFDDIDRTRVRYAAGISVQVIEQVALLMGVMGSSSLMTDNIEVKVRQFVNVNGKDEIPSQVGINIPDFRHFDRSLSTDLIDFTIGFKVNPFGSVVGFFNVILPLNNDGLRADVIPAAGVEISF